MKNSKNVYHGGRVLLDGCHFDRCIFSGGVVLVYEGGPPPTLESCKFVDFAFSMEGPAGATVAFLKSMASPQSGLAGLVADLFPEIVGMTKVNS